MDYLSKNLKEVAKAENCEIIRKIVATVKGQPVNFASCTIL